MANTERYYGTGRRKTSVARVYLMPGKGDVKVNKRSMDDYFGMETLKVIIRQPLVATGNADKFDVLVNVRGGGFTGQAGAIRHGISRALLQVDADYRPVQDALLSSPSVNFSSPENSLKFYMESTEPLKTRCFQGFFIANDLYFRHFFTYWI